MSSPQRMLVGSSRLDSSSSRMSSVIPNSRIPKSATISGLCDTKPSTRPKSVPPGARPTRPVDPPRPVDQQCTHITMTRLFTDYLVCSHCRHFPGNGWLWCCTQDRELILEDEEDRGVVVRILYSSSVSGSLIISRSNLMLLMISSKAELRIEAQQRGSRPTASSPRLMNDKQWSTHRSRLRRFSLKEKDFSTERRQQIVASIHPHTSAGNSFPPVESRRFIKDQIQ